MGVLSCEEVIQQGVRLAGVDYNAADTKQLLWLKQWLRSVALGWPWAEVQGVILVQLDAESNNISLGGTRTYANGRYIHRVHFPLKLIYGDNYLPDDINQQLVDNTLVFPNTAVPIGKPDKAAYLRDITSIGSVTLLFNKRADKAYQIQVNYQYDPATGYELGDTPWYPNDTTLVQVIAFKQSEDSNGVVSDTTIKLRDDLAQMLRDDKFKFGNTENFTTKLNRRPAFT